VSRRKISFHGWQAGHLYPATSNDGGQTWTLTINPPANFNSGSAAWTPDEGQTWYRLPNVSGYWAVAFANPQAGWFVGNNGQILKISF
jgi:hypothetical protein